MEGNLEMAGWKKNKELRLLDDKGLIDYNEDSAGHG